MVKYQTFSRCFCVALLIIHENPYKTLTMNGIARPREGDKQVRFEVLLFVDMSGKVMPSALS